MSGWFAGADRAYGAVAAVLLLRGVHRRVRLHPPVGAVIRAKVRWWPGNVTRGDMHVHHMVFGVVLMSSAGVAELAAPLPPRPGGPGRRPVRARHRAGARRVRADPAPARRVLEQRGPDVDRRGVRRGRGHRAAAARLHPGRGPVRRRQRLDVRDHRRGLVARDHRWRWSSCWPRSRCSRASSGPASSAVRAAAVHRRRHPAGPARLAVGPLAVPRPAAQAGPGRSPRTAPARAGQTGSRPASRTCSPATWPASPDSWRSRPTPARPPHSSSR